MDLFICAFLPYASNLKWFHKENITGSRFVDVGDRDIGPWWPVYFPGDLTFNHQCVVKARPNVEVLHSAEMINTGYKR